MATIKSLCVYCGSRTGNKESYKMLAEQLGRILAANHIRLVYGGGSIGLMGIVARSVMAHGGKVTGIIPRHLDIQEVGEKNITQRIVVNNMHERKRQMFDHADGFVILPGSIGTLDETIEMITWKQLHLHDKPIVLINHNGYWDPLLDMLRDIVSEGFMNNGTLSLFEVVDTAEEVLPLLRTLPEPRIDPKNTLF